MPTGIGTVAQLPSMHSVPLHLLRVQNLPVVSADNLNSFATISGSRKKVFILFLRGAVRAGMLPSKLHLGGAWGRMRGGFLRLRQAIALPIYLIALILGLRELCARPSRRFDRWRRLAGDSRLPIPGRAPWSGFGRWGGGGVPLNPGHRMGSPALPDCGEALGMARTN
jgi:hypothetical protein